MARLGQFGRLEKSAGVRTTPHEYAGSGAIRQEKNQPRTVGVSLLVGRGDLNPHLTLVKRGFQRPSCHCTVI